MSRVAGVACGRGWQGMKRIVVCAAWAACLSWPLIAAASPVVSSLESLTADYRQVPLSVGGRVASGADGEVSQQWPGVYYETAFHGDEVAFVVGAGDVILHVKVDGRDVETLVKPQGIHRVHGLGAGEHRIRVEVATESQAGPNRFGGFLLPSASTPLPVPASVRRIEFIGDSHTVGYGNLSTVRECSDAEVWATTDNTHAYGPLLAHRLGADYRVNAISGRGIVRNYDGGAGDTLPQAYPYVLFDHSVEDADTQWQPQAIVIALGTNDFSTPLKPDERWETRQALRDDYVDTYTAFVQSLRARHPQAHVVLWATDGAAGEIREQVARVLARLQQAGEERVDFVPVDGLSMEGCHWHPSLADHEHIAAVLARHLESLPTDTGQ